MRYRMTVVHERVYVHIVEADSESAVRQQWIDGDLDELAPSQRIDEVEPRIVAIEPDIGTDELPYCPDCGAWHADDGSCPAAR